MDTEQKHVIVTVHNSPYHLCFCFFCFYNLKKIAKMSHQRKMDSHYFPLGFIIILTEIPYGSGLSWNQEEKKTFYIPGHFQ